MDKVTKTNFMVKGMVESFNKNANAKLLNQIIGIKFKNIRLDNKITAEAVVQDNPKYFNSIFDLYRFESGVKTDLARVFALSNYYNYDLNILWRQFSWKGKKCGKNTH
jgi:ABC-type Na+ transport system ATPase subunit NatA|tara:strand:- start:101 stop:424 length:324 start_codon:yes stop_codon:yes gene_type:complete